MIQPVIRGKVKKQAPKRLVQPSDLDFVAKLGANYDIKRIAEEEVAKIDSYAEKAIAEIGDFSEEIIKKVNETTELLEEKVEAAINTLRDGDPGADADEEKIKEEVLAEIRKTLDKEAIIQELLLRIPPVQMVDEKALLKKLLARVPESKESLKIIRENIEVDPMAIIQKIMELPPGKFKIKSEHVDGLEQTMSAFRSQLGKGYLHGGGDTIIAGTNITTSVANGKKTVSSPYGLYNNLVFPTRPNTRTLVPTDVDQVQSVQDTTLAVGQVNLTGKFNLLAQSFVAGRTPTVGVQLWKAANTGTFTGTFKVAMQADVSGAPSGVDLASVTLTNAAYNALPVGLNLYTFTQPYFTTVSFTYWIVITTSTADDANRPNIGATNGIDTPNSGDRYTSGKARRWNVIDGWVDVGALFDLVFHVMTTRPNEINLAPYLTRSLTALYSSRLWSPTGLQFPTPRVEGGDFTWSKAGGITANSSYPGYFYAGANSVNYGTGGKQYNTLAVSFIHTGPGLSVWIGGYLQTFLVKIDDQYLTFNTATLPNDGAFWFLNLTFPVGTRRKVELVFASGTNKFFGGVYTGSSDTIQPVALRGPRTIIIGDSFTEGSNAASGAASNYVTVLGDFLGWDDIWGSGVGATGYLTAPGGKLTYRNRLATDVYPFNPDIVVFTGGINDVTAGFTAAQIAAEALLCFQAVRAALPNALIICVSPWLYRGASYITVANLAVSPLLKANVESVGGIFINVQQMPLPAHITPHVTTLTAAATAGVTTTLSTASPLSQGAHYQFANGSMVRVLNGANLIDNLTVSQLNGATLTQVGAPYITGNGYVGATTGVGNSDVLISSDSTHPTQRGHEAMAEAFFYGLMKLIRKN